jgi:hypothetical protein
MFGACFTARGQQPPPQLQERGAAAAPHVESEQPLNDYQRSQMADWARDFADLHRYRAANQELSSPVSGEHRVIFYGDSITDKWTLSQYFPGRNYINRGISGQTTSQMLVRFRQDVINSIPTSSSSLPAPTTSRATPAPSPSTTSKATSPPWPSSPALMTSHWSSRP